MPTPPTKSLPLATTAVGGLVIVLLASAVTIGADTMWLAAMGRHIVANGIPEGVPFAGADSSGWTNVPVLAELSFAALANLGTAGLPAAQLLADALALAVIAVTARSLQARDAAIAVALFLLAAGALPSFGVVRAQFLSLVPFTLLVMLLVMEHRDPSKRIWLLIPLTALWGNLHGAVLAGVAVAGAYLMFSRLRVSPAEALGVAASTIASLWLTPAGLATPSYYVGVLSNEAARRGTELWAPPSLDRPFDVLMILTALILGGIALSTRRPIWEYVVIAGLVIGTISAARHGVWLLLFLAAPAAATLTSRTSRHVRPRPVGVLHNAFTVVLALALAVAGSLVLVSRMDHLREREVRAERLAAIVGTSTVLAPEPLVEDLAAAGVRVWVSNPIDAFDQTDQAAYLDFATGGGSDAPRALAAADVVVVEAGSAHAALAHRAGFVETDRVANFAILRRP